MIFNKLIAEAKELPTSVLNILCNNLLDILNNLFLAQLTRENSFLPNDYFAAFELKRLKFNTFGNIKSVLYDCSFLPYREMTSSRIKLVLGGIIIVRVLIYFVIMHPWDSFREGKVKYKIG